MTRVSSSWTAATLGVWAILAVTAFGEHVHDLHPTTSHGNQLADGGYARRVALEDGEGFSSIVTLDSDAWEVILDHIENNYTGTPVPVTISQQRSRTHSVSVGGEVSVGGSVEAEAGQLFAKLKATAEANVTFSGSWTGTYEEGINISSSNTVPPHWSYQYQYKKKSKTASGYVDCYDHKITCQCSNCTYQWVNYCNQVTLTGSAEGWGVESGNWYDLGSNEP